MTVSEKDLWIKVAKLTLHAGTYTLLPLWQLHVCRS